MARGYDSASGNGNRDATGRNYDLGFRPAFAAKSDADYADLSVGNVVLMGTLYVGDDAIKVPTNPVSDGDITNYGKDESGVITLGAALEDTAYQMKAIYVGDGLFVCDRVMLNDITWNQLNAALS